MLINDNKYEMPNSTAQVGWLKLVGLVTPTHVCGVSGLPQAFFVVVRHAPFEKVCFCICLSMLVNICQYLPMHKLIYLLICT